MPNRHGKTKQADPHRRHAENDRVDQHLAATRPVLARVVARYDEFGELWREVSLQLAHALASERDSGLELSR